jgi:DHA1 family inner membrane transport protein
MTLPSASTSRLLALLSFGNFVIGMGAFLVIGTLVPIAQGLGLSKSEAGLVMTAYAIAYAIASPVLVALTGTVPRRTILGVGMAIFTLAAIACALAPNAGSLYAARALAAVGAGLFTPSAAAVAVAAVAPETRGKALSTVFFGLTLAQVLGVPVGSWAGYTFGWPAAFWLVAGLGIVATIATWRAVPTGVAFQPTSLKVLGQTLTDGLATAALLFSVSFLGAIYVVYTYLGALLEAKLGLGRDGVTLMLAIYGVGAVAGNWLAGRLVDRFGPYRSLMLCVTAQAILMPIVTFTPYGFWAGAVLALVWSASGWSFMTAQQVRLVSLRPQAQGVMLALNAAGIYVAAALGSAIGGAVLSVTGLEMLGLAGGAAMLIAGLLLWATERATRRAA